MYIQDMKAKYIQPIFVSCSGGYLATATRVAGEPTLHLLDLQKWHISCRCLFKFSSWFPSNLSDWLKGWKDHILDQSHISGLHSRESYTRSEEMLRKETRLYGILWSATQLVYPKDFIRIHSNTGLRTMISLCNVIAYSMASESPF